MTEVRQELTALFADEPQVPRKLRALWALYVVGGADDDFLTRALDHQSEYVRAWAVRLLCEDRAPPEAALARFKDLAAGGDSPLVRLYLAAMLQRLPADERWPLAEALVARGEDAGDANVPLMIWYGVEPLVEDDLVRFAALAGATKIPLIARHVGRRVASIAGAREGLDQVIQLLAVAAGDNQEELLAGIMEGLEGQRTVAMPAAWPAAFAALQQAQKQSVREQSLALALVFDDPAALAALRERAAGKQSAPAVRNAAIQALVAKKAADVAPLLLELIGDPPTRSAAIRGLAEYDHPETAAKLLDAYGLLDAAARQDAVQTLASRLAWAQPLLDAVATGLVPRGEISAFTARQLLSLGDEALAERVKAVWGDVRPTQADKEKLIADYKRRLTPDSLRGANRAAGRAIYQKTCANCHKLFDAGGNIGPDITGSQRTNLDYVLETLIDPSAAVARDYQMQVVRTADGRTITGLVVGESEAAVTLQTVNEKIVVPLAEIEERRVSPNSMMPDGMLQTLEIQQVRELVAYLMGTSQVPLEESPAEK
jgi:putative heme-binding domain-containing protein